MKKLILLSSIAFAASAGAQNVDKMYDEFSRVPDSTRTKVWWFHGENTTTEEGIRADLEAYSRAGVGGVVYYDQQHGPGTPDAAPSMSPTWWYMLKLSAKEAARLGLSFEMNISNGYVCGGPWITPELGMQALYSSETLVHGGTHYTGGLPQASRRGSHRVAVLAIPVKSGCHETVKCLPAGFSTREETTVLIAAFDKPFTARSLAYMSNGYSKGPQSIMNEPCDPQDDFCGNNFTLLPPLGELEVSDDSVTWRKAATLKPCYRKSSLSRNLTISFPAATGRFFRLNLHGWWKADNNTKAMIGDKPATGELKISNVELSARAATYRWEERAAYSTEYIRRTETPDYKGDEVVNRKDIIDLTARIDAQDRLDWHAPKGTDWKIIHFYYAPTNGKTKHGRKNLLGLECDKLNAHAAETHWNNYAQVIIDSLRAAGSPLSGICMDSHEAGAQNWTHDFPALFSKTCGYDITPFLPAMQGYIVNSVEETENFLHDLRRTIAGGINDRYFTTLQRMATKAGVHFTAQAMGNGQSICSDNLAAKGRVERPQGEFWTRMHNGAYDIKEAASAANIYNKHIASAEAYTDFNYNNTPGEVKDETDMAAAFRVNELVVCASESQPWVHSAGTSGPVRINTGYNRDYALNRCNPMWPLLRGFWDYQARNSYMMRQGRPVVDIIVYAGDEAPMKLLAHNLPVIPEGYDFDVCSADGLQHIDASRYRMLAIEKTAVVGPESEKRIAQLKTQGLPVFDNRTMPDNALAQMLDKAGILPDLGIRSKKSATDRVFFSHRKTDETDIYFLVNHSKTRTFADTVTLRTDYPEAEWWDAIDGKRRRLATIHTPHGLKAVLRMLPDEAGFIVARRKAATGLKTYSINTEETASPIEGPWTVTFDTLMGGPKYPVVFSELTDWTTHDNPDIKYFSGLAIYEKTIKYDLPGKRQGKHKKADTKENKRLMLRLPAIKGIARVYINGHDAGIVWCTPWETDVTGMMKNGKNDIRIEVRNSLVNRLVGDDMLPEHERRIQMYTKLYDRKSRLVPSGIVGDILLVEK
ncbi:glycosyl hydrolase [Xylanibacter rodentium]|jgi:hypothetical protein|uniref:Glycosyl hydrolase family 2 n=1 Tax=Xylanibacter rodentium TaxID=2736289 RepID=A0ABX2AYK3_9BACT|nr:glycosyl hydrolase [Xylanibacter rodentium]NPE12174.1 glycosyl hydrolase family 2 [Prevotella sp. PJ1A]NPE14462.1 glycosyl hydrolase family 2 [Xylanibacter rodentium]NPE40191.1 glycosyl hydrolase family 2 [Prevotella sp. PCJ2]